jgi:hypothetical protein
VYQIPNVLTQEIANLNITITHRIILIIDLFVM